MQRLQYKTIALLILLVAYSCANLKPTRTVHEIKNKTIKKQALQILSPYTESKINQDKQFSIANMYDLNKERIVLLESELEDSVDDGWEKERRIFFINDQNSNYVDSGIRGYGLQLVKELHLGGDSYLFFESSDCTGCESYSSVSGVYFSDTPTKTITTLKHNNKLFSVYSGRSAQNLANGQISEPEKCKLLIEEKVLIIECKETRKTYSFEREQVRFL